MVRKKKGGGEKGSTSKKRITPIVRVHSPNLNAKGKSISAGKIAKRTGHSMEGVQQAPQKEQNRAHKRSLS